MFELEGWPEFHKMWTAVRTRFIDDYVTKATATGGFAQLVNLGAGMDTRPYRMECYKTFANGCIGVDMATVNAARAKVFADFLHAPTAHCEVSSGLRTAWISTSSPRTRRWPRSWPRSQDSMRRSPASSLPRA